MNWLARTTWLSMISERIGLILAELLEGTGAAFAGKSNQDGLRSSLKIWFADLDERHGPVAELLPYGLKGHQVRLSFGNFSGDVLKQIQRASDEDVQLARALVASIRARVALDIIGQNLSEWRVMDGSFRISATVRDLDQPNSDQSLVATCRDVIVPVMAAMAELIGYDVIEDLDNSKEDVLEGALLLSVVRRRERNPRNRLLCIRIHGEHCAVCGIDPRQKYGITGGLIEVHHLQPLSTLGQPRAYDPGKDLIPLCPTCHRAVHTQRPIPYRPAELRSMMESCVD